MGECSGARTGLAQLTSVCILLPKRVGRIRLQEDWKMGPGRQPSADSPSAMGVGGEGRCMPGRGKAYPCVPAVGGVKVGKPQASTKHTGMWRTGRAPASLPAVVPSWASPVPLPCQVSFHLLPHTLWEHRSLVLIFLKWAWVHFHSAQRFSPK